MTNKKQTIVRSFANIAIFAQLAFAPMFLNVAYADDMPAASPNMEHYDAPPTQDSRQPRETRPVSRSYDDPRYDSRYRSAQRVNTGFFRPSTRSWFIELSFGNDGLGPYEFYGVSLAFGHHTSGDGSGFAWGAEIRTTTIGNIELNQAMGKFWWDIQLGSNGLYLTPFIGLGAAFSDQLNGTVFTTRGGVAFKVMMADRFYVKVDAVVGAFIDSNGNGIFNYSGNLSVGVTF